MKKLYLAASGAAAGIVAGLFGVGGGIFALPLLKKSGLDEKRSHAASVVVILGVSIPGAVIAVISEPRILKLSIPYIAGILAGGAVAALLLSKLPQPVIRICFGALLLAAAVKMTIF